MISKTNFVLFPILFFAIMIFCVPFVGAVENSWVTLEPMPTARAGLGVAVVDGKLYALGGFDDDNNYLAVNEMYDPVTDSWIQKSAMPTARASFGIAVFQNKIYVIGGETAVNYTYTGANEVYDPVTDTWETRSSLPTPRDGLATNSVDGKIYLMGGLKITLPGYRINTFDLNEVYDPASDAWTTKSPLPTPVYNPVSAVIDDKIYVVGGSGFIINQIYDPETDNWTRGKSSSYSPTYAAGVATTGAFSPKRLYVFGGGDMIPVRGTLVYNPESDEWNTGASMPLARGLLAAGVIDDKIYVVGGIQGAIGGVYATNQQYTPIDYIPEFQPLIILPLILIASFVAILLKKKIHKTQSVFPASSHVRVAYLEAIRILIVVYC